MDSWHWFPKWCRKVRSNGHSHGTGQHGKTAASDDGYGEATLGINYLTTGISAPKIYLDTTEVTNSVKVTIEYAKNSDKMKYKIDNGDWLDYTEEITVYENCTIYAKNEDVLGNTNTSSRRIKNIAYIPNYTLIDNGAYYIIHLN